MPDRDQANHRTSADAPDALGGEFAQVRDDKGDSAGPLGPRTGVDADGKPIPRRDLRVELSPKDWKLLARLRRDFDTSASGILRQSLRELGVRLYGVRAVR
jgi:hypothetical protein